MYLVKRKQGKYTYLHLMKAQRVGKTVTRTFVKSFGRLDSIGEGELKTIYEQYSKRKVDTAAAQLENILNIKENVVLADAAGASLNVVPVFHYGHLILKSLWDCTLGLRTKFDYEQAKTKINCRVSEVAFFLRALKILKPCSYLNASERKQRRHSPYRRSQCPSRSK